MIFSDAAISGGYGSIAIRTQFRQPTARTALLSEKSCAASHSYALAASTSGAPEHDWGDPGQLDPRYLPRMRPMNRMTGKTMR